MAMTNAEKSKRYRNRKAEKVEAVPANNTTKHQRFRELIAEAQALAAEINAEKLAEIQAQPLTRDTARQLDALEKTFRVTFAEICLPVNS